MCEALAVRNPEPRQAIEAARPLATAHLILGRVERRIRELNQSSEAGPLVKDGDAVEYFNRIGAAVGQHLWESNRIHLVGLLPDKASVPYGTAVDPACEQNDHPPFAKGLASECTDILVGQRHVEVHATLCFANGIDSLWEDALLDWVDRTNVLRAQDNPIRELLQRGARASVGARV